MKVARFARLRWAALDAAVASASVLISVPMPRALGSSGNSASRIGAARVRQLQQQRRQERAGAGAEIGDAQRTLLFAFGADNFKRALDYGLGIGPRQQRGRGKLYGQAPKFFLADDTRNRLAGESPFRELL